jgi:formylglycine-generating enzyme required for sulfatase activity
VRTLHGTTHLRLALCLSTLLFGACTQGPAASPTYRSGEPKTRPTDGADVIYVPAGDFLMGSKGDDGKAGDDEQPQHTVTLDAFWIDRTEVTNIQYMRFLNALGGHMDACSGRQCLESKVEDKDSHIVLRGGQYRVEVGYEEHPVIEVTWHGAQAYCEWAGFRLPTEAEWEKAARGDDGRIYPWGDEPPDCGKAQYGDCGGTTAPVGANPTGASPYGVLNMAGNVWEWVSDWYDPTYYQYTPARNPQGPNSGEHKVFRGGSWGYPPAFIRAASRARNHASYAGFNLGFRCASSIPPPAAGEMPGHQSSLCGPHLTAYRSRK